MQILFENCGRFPNALQGASNKILSNDSSENGGPFKTSKHFSSSATIFEESAWIKCAFAPNVAQVSSRRPIFLGVLSIAINIPWKQL